MSTGKLQTGFIYIKNVLDNINYFINGNILYTLEQA